MITDKDYNKIAKDVYNVDPLKKKPSFQKVGKKVADEKFVIIEPPANAENGMQAMAVA